LPFKVDLVDANEMAEPYKSGALGGQGYFII
jgi:hypothetical protein